MTRSELGRHFVIGLRPTPDLHPQDERLLAYVQPSSVAVFRGNFLADAPYEVWHARFARLIGAIREAVGRTDVLVCIDHEGGTVVRPPSPITPFASARSWADRAERSGACARLLNAGTDLMLVCSHWTDTERVRWMLADMVAAENSGALDESAIRASRRCIEELRTSTPAHTPHLLPADTLRKHASIAPLRSRAGRAGQTVSLDEQ